MTSEAQNLEAIQRALDAHAGACPNPATEIRMCPFEVDRLGWEAYRGLAIVADPQMQTGRVRIGCANARPFEHVETREAIRV